MPSTIPPLTSLRSVVRVTGVVQPSPGGRTAACTPTVLPPQTATACPSGLNATTGCCPPCGSSPPGPRSAACHVLPSGLVHTSTCVVPPEAWKVPPATMAPALFTDTELPHGPGSWTGADHVPARAGSAGETPSATRDAADTKAPRPIHLRERVGD